MNDHTSSTHLQNEKRTDISISPRTNRGSNPLSPSYFDYDPESILGNQKNTVFFDIDVGEERERMDDNNIDTIDAEYDDRDRHRNHIVHDQLPSVEEAKFYNTTSRRNQKQKTKQTLSKRSISLGIVIVGVLSLSGVFLGRRHQHQKAVASVTETVRLSHPGAFRNSKSPQSRALRWMLHEDSLQLPLPATRTDPFVQRYVVAVLVFALTNAKTKTLMSQENLRNTYALLSGTHECEWNSVDTEGVTTGIICGSNGMGVTDILFSRTGLDGELPPEMEVLNHLVKVDMNGNRIHGTLPVMPYLTNLDAAYNQLTGYLPSHFSEMTRLQILSLSENALQGSIPHKFAALADLKILALNGNQLTGGLEEIYPLSKLEELYLFSNSFEDSFSNDSFQELSNLKVIDMKNNRLSGPLPDALFSKLTNLEVIDFHKNALDGSINNVIAKNHPLKYLDVSSNLLGGKIPSSINNLRALTHLDLSYNRLEMRLPPYLKDLTKMRTLLFTEEDSLGPQPLPTWLRKMTDLTQLSFRLTSRTGTIPTWFGELTRLELLDLDWNHISGTIPTELGRLTNLKYLMLNRNRMTGTIPTEVSSLPNLEMLMVDTNEFTGSLFSGDEETPDGKSVVCTAEGANRKIVRMIADCGRVDHGDDDDNAQKEVDCPCCTSCCKDDDFQCNMRDWIIELEDEYRSSYYRFLR